MTDIVVPLQPPHFPRTLQVTPPDDGGTAERFGWVCGCRWRTDPHDTRAGADGELLAHMATEYDLQAEVNPTDA